MRTFVSVLLIIMLSVASQAQDIASSSVPSIILNSFQQQYPSAYYVEWEIEGNLYKVDFEIGITDHDAWYDASGKLVKHQNDIQYRNLPDNVKQSLSKHFKGYHFSDAKIIYANGITTYELEAEKGDEERKLIIDSAGAIVLNELD